MNFGVPFRGFYSIWGKKGVPPIFGKMPTQLALSQLSRAASNSQSGPRKGGKHLHSQSHSFGYRETSKKTKGIERKQKECARERERERYGETETIREREREHNRQSGAGIRRAERLARTALLRSGLVVGCRSSHLQVPLKDLQPWHNCPDSSIDQVYAGLSQEGSATQGSPPLPGTAHCCEWKAD